MKTIYLILIIVLLSACGQSPDEVVISKEDYKQLIGDTIQPVYPKIVTLPQNYKLYSNSEITIYLGSDGHEYQLHPEYHYGGQWIHYGGCEKCQKERGEMNNKLDSILQKLKTIKNK